MVSIMVSKTIDQSSSLCLPAKKIIWREQPVRNRDCLLSRSFTLGGLGRNPASPQRLYKDDWVYGVIG